MSKGRLEPQNSAMNRKLTIGMIACFAVCGAAWLVAQGQAPIKPEKPSAKKNGTMKLTCGVGSFWCEGEGRIEMTFVGTLLISEFQGKTLSVTGNVRKEWDKYGRQTWFAAEDGAGKPAKLVLEGKWRRVNWFGADLTATWVGNGLTMLFGEFDERTGSTGTIQIDNGEKQPWYSTGTTHYLPERQEHREPAQPPSEGA